MCYKARWDSLALYTFAEFFSLFFLQKKYSSIFFIIIILYHYHVYITYLTVYGMSIFFKNQLHVNALLQVKM